MLFNSAYTRLSEKTLRLGAFFVYHKIKFALNWNLDYDLNTKP